MSTERGEPWKMLAIGLLFLAAGIWMMLSDSGDPAMGLGVTLFAVVVTGTGVLMLAQNRRPKGQCSWASASWA